MSIGTPKWMKEILMQVTGYLVNGQFDKLEAWSNGTRLRAVDMERAVSDYGEKLVMPPDLAFDSIDAIEIRGSEPKRWSVRFDLWTDHGGQSDLSLEMTIIERALPEIEIDNIHVL